MDNAAGRDPGAKESARSDIIVGGAPASAAPTAARVSSRAENVRAQPASAVNALQANMNAASSRVRVQRSARAPSGTPASANGNA
jgi:hypothetical protein